MNMQLISLTLENFKGHERLALRFDGQDASIYGENGTGKSSVYDGLTWLLFPDKRLVPAAYVWLALMALTVLITMMVLLEGESEARMLFLHFFAMAVPAPLILGGIMSFFLYRRHLKTAPKAEKFLERGVRE